MTAAGLPEVLNRVAATLLTDPAIVAVQIQLVAPGLSSITTWPPGPAAPADSPVVDVPVAADLAAPEPLGELRVYLSPGHAVPALLITQLRATGQLVAALLDTQSQLHDARELALSAQSLAERDELTGLGNRRGWIRALHTEGMRCRRHPAPTTVITLDLDRLKQANDRHGHVHGDALLQRTGTVLAEQCRASDSACRVGGDEFALLAPHTPAGAAEAVVARLRAALDRAGVAASLGWAVAPQGAELASTWARADELMYAEKARRRAIPVGPLR